jgi:transaldolase/glucose-6-phosphate isomerase
VRDLRALDEQGAAVDALAGSGHPVFELDVDGADALGAEFFRWEFATAVAGAMLGVNPFDQPDVESAKVATRAITDAYDKGDEPPPRAPSDAPSAMPALLASVRAGDYVALLAFLPMTAPVQEALHRVRTRIRDKTRAATIVGFGPRYLHSTGQAFKGGPNSGVFIQLTCDAPNDVAIPGRRLTFGGVIAAQAAGDRQVLRERGRRVVHIHLDGDLAGALQRFVKDVESALP